MVPYICGIATVADINEHEQSETKGVFYDVF
jgi:hypothetical protein